LEQQERYKGGCLEQQEQYKRECLGTPASEHRRHSVTVTASQKVRPHMQEKSLSKWSKKIVISYLLSSRFLLPQEFWDDGLMLLHY